MQLARITLLIITISFFLNGCNGTTSNPQDLTDNSNKMGKNNYNIPEDVIQKILSEYPNNKQQEFVTKSLIKLGVKWEFQSARIPRCILFLSKGNLELFKKNLKYAETDWRDIIYWAEYDSNDIQVFDFNKTFKQNGF
jgi:hypothetical protein